MPLLFILAIVMSIVIALAITITTTVAICHFETPALLWGSSCLMLSPAGPVALLPSRHFGLRPRIPRIALKVVFPTLAFQQKDLRIAFEVRLNQGRSFGKSLEKTWGWLWRV